MLSGDGAHTSCPDQRDIGMVFQNYAIWPHMTVYENVAFPLRVEQPQAAARGDRRAGQRGARAGPARRPRDRRPPQHVRRPAAAPGAGPRAGPPAALLLLDEPLSNLDAKLRDEMRIELRELQRRLGITTLYVTHDQAEALACPTASP